MTNQKLSTEAMRNHAEHLRVRAANTRSVHASNELIRLANKLDDEADAQASKERADAEQVLA